MTFQIATATKAKLDDVRVLSQKNRQADENPGVQLPFSMKLSNHILGTLDASLKQFLFTNASTSPEPTATKRKDNSTGTLDGVEAVTDMPKLSSIGGAVKTLQWHTEVTAGELTISFATTKLLLDDCKAHSFRIQPQEGGTVNLKFIVDAPNASEQVFAKLAKYKSREVEIAFVQHEPAQQDIEDDDPPAEPRKPGAAEKAAAKVPPTTPHKTPRQTAEEAFADGADVSAKKELEPAKAWPFPTADKGSAPPPQSVTIEQSQPGTRTARGRDKTAAALAAGAKS